MPIATLQSAAAQTDATLVTNATAKKIKFRIIHISCASGEEVDVHEETSGTKYFVSSGSYSIALPLWQVSDVADKKLQVTSSAGSSVVIEYEYV